MINCGIYVIVNLVNNKKYIGSTINFKNRWDKHKKDLKNNKHHSIHLQRAWNKYGEENFLFEVLEYVQDVNDLIQIEQYYLDWMETWKEENGYNICSTAGSTLGIKLSVEIRKQRSERVKGAKNPMYGKHFSDESKEKMAITQRGEKSAVAKLTWDIVNKIRQEYLVGDVSYRVLARKYNVCDGTIQAVIENRTWYDPNYIPSSARKKKRYEK